MSGLRERWSAWTPRERTLVGVAAAVAGMMLVFAIVGAIRDGLASLRDDVATRSEAIALAQTLARSPAPAARAPLLGAAERAARSSGVGSALKGLTQETGGRVTARLEGARLDAVARMVGAVLRDSGGSIESLKLTRTAEPGLVDVSMTLAPGAQ